MDNAFLNLLRSMANEREAPVWDDGLLRKEGSGHMWEVAELDVVHAGRDSTNGYLLGKLLGDIDEKTGLAILEAVGRLQVTDPENDRFGAFRWYAEESGPIDTNAAFFTLLPLAVLRLYEPGLATDREKVLIDGMLCRSAPWFRKECRNPILYYTNKILSDGAMLTAIGNITGDREIEEEAGSFLLKWLEYTEDRGFGWGENLSPGYNGIIIQAAAIIMKCLGEGESYDRFKRIEKGILETFRFHDGYEFVPAIRSYNVSGTLKPWRILNNLAQVRGFGLRDAFSDKDPAAVSNLAKAIVIYGSRLYLDERDYEEKGYSNDRSIPASVTTHIMDDVKACSWLGNNGGMGSLNRFPVVDGSYQHKGWGLGWQCFPVSVIAYGEQVSFLRFNVNDGQRWRYHPHKDKHSCYLDPALFANGHYPEVKTSCRQTDNTLVAVRSITGLCNKASHISDSFDVQRFGGSIGEYHINGRKWHVLSYENASVCLTPLLGLVHGADCAGRGNIVINKSGEDVSLVQVLYDGEPKTIADERISSGWIIHFIDRGMDESEISRYLSSITVDEACGPDGMIPRLFQWDIHEVSVRKDGREILGFRYDPYV